MGVRGVVLGLVACVVCLAAALLNTRSTGLSTFGRHTLAGTLELLSMDSSGVRQGNVRQAASELRRQVLARPGRFPMGRWSTRELVMFLRGQCLGKVRCLARSTLCRCAQHSGSGQLTTGGRGRAAMSTGHASLRSLCRPRSLSRSARCSSQFAPRCCSSYRALTGADEGAGAAAGRVGRRRGGERPLRRIASRVPGAPPPPCSTPPPLRACPGQPPAQPPPSSLGIVILESNQGQIVSQSPTDATSGR